MPYALAERIRLQAEFLLDYEMKAIIRDHKLQRGVVAVAGRVSLDVSPDHAGLNVEGESRDIHIRVVFDTRDQGRMLTISEVRVPRLARIDVIDDALAPGIIDFAARLMDGLYAD